MYIERTQMLVKCVHVGSRNLSSDSFNISLHFSFEMSLITLAPSGGNAQVTTTTTTKSSSSSSSSSTDEADVTAGRTDGGVNELEQRRRRRAEKNVLRTHSALAAKLEPGSASEGNMQGSSLIRTPWMLTV